MSETVPAGDGHPTQPVVAGRAPAGWAAGELGDTVVRTLMGVGLHLQESLPGVDPAAKRRLHTALDDVDRLIRAVREEALAASSSAGPNGGPDRGVVRMVTPGATPAVHVGRLNPDVHRLLDESQLLRDRLYRVAVALAITEEFTADAFDRMAAAGGPEAGECRATADRTRASARICREVGARLDELSPSLARPSTSGGEHSGRR